MALPSKEVTELAHNLQKPDLSSSFLLSSLSKLKAGITPTEDLLRSTKIGVAVAKLKQNPDAEVAQQATELVSRWRGMVKSKEKKSAAGGVKENGAGSRSSTPGVGTPQSPAPPSSALKPPLEKEKENEKREEKAKVPPEKRDAASDGVDVNKTGDKVRDGCLKLMYNGLAFMSEEPPTTILPLATAIENAAFAQFPPIKGDPSPPYRTKIRSLFQNLKIPSNTHLRHSLLSGTTAPSHFVTMSDEELQSPERRSEIEKMEKENFDKAMVAKEEKSISASFVCGRCKQRKVSYTQAQTRSADEPMTTFCTCENCGNKWKFS